MSSSTLDELPTEELRARAFDLARKRLDLRFFFNVIAHLPHAPEAQEVDGSLGSVGPAVDSVVELWHELAGHGYGDREPLLRAAFIDYLRGASAEEPA
ncbi:MAG: hypothetical protein ACRDXX_12420 [Stackebrandtia sp.]